jgi:hypothetical protein
MNVWLRTVRPPSAIAPRACSCIWSGRQTLFACDVIGAVSMTTMEAMIVKAVATFSLVCFILIFLYLVSEFVQSVPSCRSTLSRTLDERRSDVTLQPHEVKSPEKVGEKR